MECAKRKRKAECRHRRQWGNKEKTRGRKEKKHGKNSGRKEDEDGERKGGKELIGFTLQKKNTYQNHLPGKRKTCKKKKEYLPGKEKKKKKKNL